MRFFLFLACTAACQAATFKIPISQALRETVLIESSSFRDQGGRQNSPWKQPQLDPFPSKRRLQRPRRKGPIGGIENDQFYGDYIKNSKHYHDTQSSTITTMIPYLNDLTYTINITLGTPPQPFTVLLSISSPGLVIPSSSCSDGYGCTTLRRYNTSLSSTSSSDPEHSFRTPHSRFDSSAYRSADNLDLSGIQIPGQNFAQAIAYFPLLEPLGAWDGVLGLAPESVSSPRVMLNPFQEMSARGMLDRNLFSLRLPQGSGQSGEIAFGSIDADSYVGELKRLSLVPHNGSLSPDPRWAVSVRSLEMGAGFLDLERYVAFLQTDFPFIGLPADFVDLLDRNMGMESSSPFQMPSMDCEKRNRLENLVITLGGHEFEISPWEYTLEIEGEEMNGERRRRCVSAFISLPDKGDDAKYIVLGTAFLRAFYSVFDGDERSVSLAKATQLSKGSKIEGDSRGLWDRLKTEI